MIPENPALQSLIQWVDASASLPDDDITVLIADTEGDVSLGFHDSESGWRYASAGLVGDPVTHWAHLPTPPSLRTCDGVLA